VIEIPTDRPLVIHLIAIGGTGMAPLACLLKERGHTVRGSDGPLYPPMSDLLAEAGIVPWEGFDPAHLDPAPDLVIVGNAVRADNPEATAAEGLGLPRVSMPEALGQLFLAGRRPLVVAGTHGKTTTSSLAAWVYADAGRDPGFLVGGVPQNLGVSFRAGAGPRFVIEGDEYNAAYFDRGPKFLHYRPQTAILTSVEHDHADLYPDPESLAAAYARLIALLPADGLLIACGDGEGVRALAEAAPCPVVFYGLGEENDLRPAGGVEQGPSGCRFAVDDPEGGRIEVLLPLAGEHNVANALAAWAAARADGIPGAEIAGALARFRGVRRRLEEVGSAGGVVIVDDFAHHPTAVGVTLEAVRGRYPGRRLVAVFEPRTMSAGRRIFYSAYLAAFRGADRVLIAPVFHAGRLAAGEAIDRDALCAELTAAGTPAEAATSLDDLFERALGVLEPGDLVLTMSSGAFGDMPRRLLAALADG